MSRATSDIALPSAAIAWVNGDTKRGQLRRLKRIAAGLLAVMAVLFIVSARYAAQLPALMWLEAFSEAALVGGLADWFAVVALFRNPGGLRLPHTAIIPHNKDRIGAQLGVFVEQNFLTPEIIREKLRDYDLAARIVGWFANAENARRIVSAAREEFPRFLGALNDPELESAVTRVIEREIEHLDLPHLLARLLALITRDHRHQRLLDDVLPVLTRWLDEHRAEIKVQFGRRSRLTPPWIDAYIVNRLVDGVIDWIDEVGRTPGHEIRVAFDSSVRRFTMQLRTDPTLARRLNLIRARMLRSRATGVTVAAIWKLFKARLAAPPRPTRDAGDAWIARLIATAAQEIVADRALLDRLNANILAAIESSLASTRNGFAALIADIVRTWDSALVTDKVELELGPDLQFIRFNGTCIGGLAGLALHGLLVLAAATR